jgi:hypothetical protein
MFANKRTREMISNLKGRISKALSFSKKLSEDEKLILGGIYNSIDEIILWNKKLTQNKATRFKNVLREYANLIEDSNKIYIQKHITPILKKVVEQEWTSND